jgi:large subunit ribosomal protein L6
MSKIGKKPIEILDGVTASIEGKMIKVTGPKGVLDLDTRNQVKVEIKDKEIIVTSKDESTQFLGLYRTLIDNMVKGVKEGFTKKLEFTGIGYKASVQGGDLVLNVGYSHPVTIKKPEEIEFATADNTITISGIDKVKVGDVAAKIRSVRPPEPYKGKGIRYQGEKIIRKQAKTAA